MNKTLWAFGIIRIITIKFYTIKVYSVCQMYRCAWQDERVKQSNDEWSTTATSKAPWKEVNEVSPRCQNSLEITKTNDRTEKQQKYNNNNNNKIVKVVYRHLEKLKLINT